jgi:hypothetical protein
VIHFYVLVKCVRCFCHSHYTFFFWLSSRCQTP